MHLGIGSPAVGSDRQAPSPLLSPAPNAASAVCWRTMGSEDHSPPRLVRGSRLRPTSPQGFCAADAVSRWNCPVETTASNIYHLSEVKA
jgi:hypothetical protein